MSSIATLSLSFMSRSKYSTYAYGSQRQSKTTGSDSMTL